MLTLSNSNWHICLKRKTVVITTYALCGFANLSSMGMLIGAFGAMAPTRKAHVTRIVFSAMVAGSLASYMTGSIAGLPLNLNHLRTWVGVVIHIQYTRASENIFIFWIFVYCRPFLWPRIKLINEGLNTRTNQLQPFKIGFDIIYNKQLIIHRTVHEIFFLIIFNWKSYFLFMQELPETPF